MRPCVSSNCDQCHEQNELFLKNDPRFHHQKLKRDDLTIISYKYNNGVRYGTEKRKSGHSRLQICTLLTAFTKQGAKLKQCHEFKPHAISLSKQIGDCIQSHFFKYTPTHALTFYLDTTVHNPDLPAIQKMTETSISIVSVLWPNGL